jgi:hypothetical protein
VGSATTSSLIAQIGYCPGVACIDNDTLFDYVEGRLSDEDTSRVIAHAEECPRCHEELAQVATAFLRDSTAAATGRSDNELTFGARIGRHTVSAQLGAGGIGVVYAARDPISIARWRSNCCAHNRSRPGRSCDSCPGRFVHPLVLQRKNDRALCGCASPILVWSRCRACCGLTADRN